MIILLTGCLENDRESNSHFKRYNRQYSNEKEHVALIISENLNYSSYINVTDFLIWPNVIDTTLIEYACCVVVRGTGVHKLRVAQCLHYHL